LKNTGIFSPFNHKPPSEELSYFSLLSPGLYIYLFILGISK